MQILIIFKRHKCSTSIETIDRYPTIDIHDHVLILGMTR